MFEFQTLSSQIHRQGAVPTLNYRAVLGYGEEEGAWGKRALWLFFSKSLAVLY